MTDTNSLTMTSFVDPLPQSTGYAHQTSVKFLGADNTTYIYKDMPGVFIHALDKTRLIGLPEAFGDNEVKHDL